MPSFSTLPESHDVYIAWTGGEATISQIQYLRSLVAELSELSLQDIYKTSRGSSRFFLGRIPYLRAIEIRRLCLEGGISVELR